MYSMTQESLLYVQHDARLSIGLYCVWYTFFFAIFLCKIVHWFILCGIPYLFAIFLRKNVHWFMLCVVYHIFFFFFT